ncbi:MAG: sigma-70 family RNA polymerase sigma factor [Bacteroidales bacterium]|jgi:RNA polymerase sigma factor (sigma-70 family)|nr:sigma-70 family RNA polymerase sigma factor [Bacteroidales bacterium]
MERVHEHAIVASAHFSVADVVREYGQRLRAFIGRRVRQKEDAEDILQDVYEQLAEADLMMRPIDMLAAWLFTVARNRITDMYRKKKPEPAPEFGADTPAVAWLPDSATPETEYMRTAFREQFDAALASLPPNSARCS